MTSYLDDLLPALPPLRLRFFTLSERLVSEVVWCSPVTFVLSVRVCGLLGFELVDLALGGKFCGTAPGKKKREYLFGLFLLF